MNLLQEIDAAKVYIEKRISSKPQIAVILGTGLSGLKSSLTITEEIPYEDIPGFCHSTVEGHAGKLLAGTISGKPMLAMQGRLHYYEGYSMQEITFPIRVFQRMGITHLFVSNAAGGLNPAFSVGDIMSIHDHLNFFPENPLRGKWEPWMGDRFLDLSDCYDKHLLLQAQKVADEMGVSLKQGVYAGVSGPHLETEAEYKFLHNAGADAVGMSTIPEILVGRQGGMKCFAISIITDLGIPGKIKKVTLEEISAVAAATEPKLSQLMKKIIELLP